jgi:hypothetical protein
VDAGEALSVAGPIPSADSFFREEEEEYSGDTED